MRSLVLSSAALSLERPLVAGPARWSLIRGQIADDDEYLDMLEEQLAAAVRPAPSRFAAAAPPPSPRPRRPPRPPSDGDEYSRSASLSSLPERLASGYTAYVERPSRKLILGSLAILFGFFSAGALSTIFGAAGFWEPIIALGPLFVSEFVTREYYSRRPEARSATISILNAAKVGLLFGICVDAVKLAG